MKSAVGFFKLNIGRADPGEKCELREDNDRRGDLIAGRSDGSIKVLAFKAGVAAFLEKPLAEGLLFATVDRVVKEG